MTRFIDIVFFIMIIVICFMSTYSFVTVVSKNVGQVKYDCGVAEISPDYPQKVKEDCRKLLERK